MKGRSRRLIAGIAMLPVLAILMMLGASALGESDSAGAVLPSWAEGESRTAFLSYLDDVTDENSESYIPEVDRIAVFDLDGTLCGEQFPTYFDWMLYATRVLDDPSYTATEEQIEVAEEILTAAREKSVPADLEERQYTCNLEVFAGMTVAAYREYVARFLETGADRFDGLTIGNAYFRTTVEAARCLTERGFTVYIVSGTDREADRVMIAERIGVPYRQIIGTDSYTVGSGQGDNGYLDYQYVPGDEPVRTANGIIKTVKSSKPMQIAQEIGQRPVVAFGNSSGDISMFRYTTENERYRSIAFCVIPDDDAREVAYPDRVEKLTALCAENGWHTISMRDDFVTIYGDDVKADADSTPWLDRMEQLLEEAQTLQAAA